MWGGLRAVWLCALLAGCAPAGPPEPARTQPIAYVLDAGGIQVTGQPGRVDFGRTDHSAISAMTRLVGQGASTQGVCGALSYATWADETVLYFTEGALRGWSSPTGRAGLTCDVR